MGKEKDNKSSNSTGKALAIVAYACLVGVAVGVLMSGIFYFSEQATPDLTPAELAALEAEYGQVREDNAKEVFAQLQSFSSDDITEFHWEYGGFLDLDDFDLSLLFDDIELVGPMDYTVRRGDPRGFEITLNDGISIDYNGYFTDGSLDKTFSVLSYDDRWDFSTIVIQNPALWEVLKDHVDPEW